jgi:drug/metabolite transporter (DMT)-like permease
MPPARHTPADPLTAGPLAAYAAICLIWGSTFLAIRIAVETLPPFAMIGVRSLVAGAVLGAVALWRRAALPDRRALASAALSGILMFAFSQAVLSWGETRLPSGPAAVLGCTVSLFTPVASWLLGASARPSRRAALGLLAGFAGVFVLVRPATGARPIDMMAAIVVLLSAVSWSFGAALARRVPPARSALLGSALQLLFGGIGSLAIAAARGEWAGFDPSQVSARSLLAMLYLIVMGSLVAFACFGWLVQIWQPERLSTYAYINPLVALGLGAALGGEAVGVREVTATALILGAVALVMVGAGQTSFLEKRSKKLLGGCRGLVRMLAL